MISASEEQYMQLALDVAQKSPCNMKHGAVCVVKGRVVGRGYNHYRGQARDGFIQNSCTCHAEIAAVRNAYHQLDKSHDRVYHSIKVAKDQACF